MLFLRLATIGCRALILRCVGALGAFRVEGRSNPVNLPTTAGSSGLRAPGFEKSVTRLLAGFGASWALFRVSGGLRA